jgi:hypothetical protein
MKKLALLFLLSLAGFAQASSRMEQDNPTQRQRFYIVKNPRYTQQDQIADRELFSWNNCPPRFFMLQKESNDSAIITKLLKPGRDNFLRAAMQRSGPLFFNTYAVVDETIKRSMSQRDILDHLIIMNLTVSVRELNQADLNPVEDMDVQS